MKHPILTTLATLLFVAASALAAPPPEVKAKAEKRLAELQSLASEATVIAEVKAYNAKPASSMTNDAWKALSVISPEVKELTKNTLGIFLKGKKTPDIAEIFVNGADGGKVAFLSKTSNWTHKGKAKHDQPMAGKTWMGDVELDESTGKQSVQVALPIKDGDKVIGSIVIGLSVPDLK